MADKTKRDLASVDAFLTAGGFRRAKRPKGALVRSRSKCDDRKAPKTLAKKTRKIEIIRPQGWHKEWLVSGFSTRIGGHSTVFGGNDLNLGFTAHDSKKKVEKNRKEFFKALRLLAVGDRQPDKARKWRIVNSKQIHSAIIHVIDSGKAAHSELVGDGLITNCPGVLLGIQTADCVPVLLMDPKKKAIGAFHAGWRGTVQRIVEKGVGVMRMQYGSDPAGLHAAIGPSIQKCCYTVGDEVVDQFHSQFAYARSIFREVYDDDPIKLKYPLLFLTARAPGHSNIGPQIHLDLVEANRRQLLDAGLRPENIWPSNLCTSCHTDKLFSHRKEDGFTGRMMAVVGLKESG